MNYLIFVFVLLLELFNEIDSNILFNRSISSIDTDGYSRISKSNFKCLKRLEECSSSGWSLRFKMQLHSMIINDKSDQYLLFSTGADQSYGDGIGINFIQSKPYSYLQFFLKQFYTDQISYRWNLEIDLQINRWIDLVITVQQISSHFGKSFLGTIYIDGYRYNQTIIEQFIEGSTFKYQQIYPRFVTIYANQSGLCSFDQILYYERLLTHEDISQGNSAQFVFFL